VCGGLAPHSQAALAAGALDVVGALDGRPDSPQYAIAVQRHLRVAARVRVITHPRSRLRDRGIGRSGPSLTAPAPHLARQTRWQHRAGSRGVRLVVIGASTGGPLALATILSHLPRDFPVPVLVVQHMADGFVEGLASWLDSVSSLRVTMVEHGQRLLPERVYVAPAGSNTMVRTGLRIELCPPQPGQFHMPGVDATFASAAATCGVETVGVLLTGMGRDGAEGLRALHERGGLTIGQDEPTSVVWGMPAAALALGAVQLELPLPAIGPAIVRALHERGITGADAAARP
jgi:two-component system chemotaxis response regulator CheB